MSENLNIIAGKMQDARSKKVILLSHCLLNENTRYLGGAAHKGFDQQLVLNSTIEDCGLVQLPCPEQLAWGGVLKPLMWLPLGTKDKRSGVFWKAAFPFFLLYTHFRYRWIAEGVVKTVADYQRNGFEVVRLIAVDGSPTCGLHKTLSMAKSFEYISGLSTQSLNRSDFNHCLYHQCSMHGAGLFIEILQKRLIRRGLHVPFTAIDLESKILDNTNT